MVDEARLLISEDFKAIQPPWRRVQFAAYCVDQVVPMLRKFLTEAPEPTLGALEKLADLVHESADNGAPCEGFREAVGTAKYLPTTTAPVHNPASNRGQRSVGSAIAQAIVAAGEAVLDPGSDATFTAYKEVVHAAQKGALGTAVTAMHQEFKRLKDLRTTTLAGCLPNAGKRR